MTTLQKHNATTHTINENTTHKNNPIPMFALERNEEMKCG